jgi:Dynamin central region
VCAWSVTLHGHVTFGYLMYLCECLVIVCICNTNYLCMYIGTDAQDALLNRVIPLKRGFIGVVNRGQKVIRRISC